MPVPERWWGACSIPSGLAAQWTVGPLELRVRRGPTEWELAWRSEGDPMLEREAFELPFDYEPADLDESWERARFGFSETAGELVLTPMLADRAVVARPESPFYVPRGQRVTVYVSTPLTARVEADGTRLVDVPVHRLSDTWFGPSTIEGEVCYAARTRMHLSFDGAALRSHRAITPVVLTNRASTPLLVARMRLPVPNLSVFVAPDGGMWTEQIRMEAGGDVADVRMDDGPPHQAPAAELITSPRIPWRGNLAMRVFSAVFS